VLALAAVEVVGGRIRAGGVARVLRQAQPSSADNILVHGITPTTQAAGVALESALLEFLEYAGKDPLVAFHAGFDREVLGRACRETLGVRLPNAWLDMAALAQALAPEAINGRADLDRLVAHFGISTGERHRAVSDARATAELFLMLLVRARERRVETLSALQACAERSAFNGAGRGLAAP
jgi:DNA polymerase-3 subunit epsilon